MFSRLIRCGQSTSVWLRSLQQCHTITATIIPTAEKDPSNDIMERHVPHMKGDLMRILMTMKPDSPPNSRALRVALLGCPNSGKSSLVNMICHWRVCATSIRVNTTRSKQTAIYTDEDTQLIFVDLPGVLSENKVFNHKLEKTLIRDPHAAIFDADLIIVVVDISHKYSCKELDKEVLRALYYFADKPSILVLNKIDCMPRRRGRLLDVIRRLTEGVVADRVSHFDKYTHLRKRRLNQQIVSPSFSELEELRVKHLAVRGGSAGNALPSPPEPIQDGESAPLLRTLPNPQSIQLLSCDWSQSCEDILATLPAFEMATTQPDSSTTLIQTQMEKEGFLDEYALTVWKHLEEVMLLKSVSKEVVRQRRARWHLVREKVKTQIAWPRFREVFMCSSLTGEGVDVLRKYLLSQATPRPWTYHSSLVTDTDPQEIIRMCVQAHCLNYFEDGLLSRKIRVRINEYDKSQDDTLYIHVTLQCVSQKHLSKVLGPRGDFIKELARLTRTELQQCFKANVVLKLDANCKTVPGAILKTVRRAKSLKVSLQF